MATKLTSKVSNIKYVGKRPSADQDNPCREKLCDMLRNVGCFRELCADKLYLIYLANDADPKEFCEKHSDEPDCPFVFWGIHNGPSLNYESYNMDFGPLNLAVTHQFISKLKVWIDTLPYRDHDKHIAIVLDDKDTKVKLNTTLLVAIAAMVLLNLTDNEVIQRLEFFMMHKGKPGEMKELVFREKKKFADVSGNQSAMNLTLDDCIRAFYAALHYKFYDYYQFDPAEYLFYETVMSGDLNWIVPGKILAFAGPCDKPGSSRFYYRHPPKFYYQYFNDHNVTTIIRLNDPEYERSSFVEAGFDHHDLIFPDGYPPTLRIAEKFIKIVDEAKGAVAVHCYAGIGRTGTLIAAYLMSRYNFQAAMAVAWTRICRPGSVIGDQQDWLLLKFDASSKLDSKSPKQRKTKPKPLKTQSSIEEMETDESPKTTYAMAEKTFGQAKALVMTKKQRDKSTRHYTRSAALQKSWDEEDGTGDETMALSKNGTSRTNVILDLGKTVPLELGSRDLEDLKGVRGKNPDYYHLRDGKYVWKVKFPRPSYVVLKYDYAKDNYASSCLELADREPILDFRFDTEPSVKSMDEAQDEDLEPRLKPVVYYSLLAL